MDNSRIVLRRHGFRYRFLRADPVTGLYFATIRFPTGNGGRGSIEVPPSILNSRPELQRRLRDQDAKLPTEKKRLDELLSALARSQPEYRQCYARTAGWSDDKRWFATGKQVLGIAPDGQLATRPTANTAGEPGGLRKCGTARSWRDTVGKLALFSSVSMLAVCAALAAPLLIFTDRTSFGICLFGRSRSGKTLASLCGASFTGIGQAEELVGWRSTETAIEERLAEFVDSIFVLDDISAMDAPEAAQYERLRRFAYMLATNQGKGRARAYKRATGMDHARHRTIAFTSAEQSIAALAQRSRHTRLGGEQLRLIDLPATDADQDHIFDRLPDDFDRAAQTAWLSRTYGKMVKACRQHHGAVFRTYVSRLIKLRRVLRTKTEELVATFVKHLATEAYGPEARDLAEKFGLLFAGGMIGIELKCVPWTDVDVLAAVTTCYRRARTLLTDEGQILESGLETLYNGLRLLPKHVAKRGPPVGLGKADGFQQWRSEKLSFVIKTEAFNRLLPDGRQRELVHEWLAQQAAIVRIRTRGVSGPLKSRPATQFTWPDGKRRRSFKISWPSGTAPVVGGTNK